MNGHQPFQRQKKEAEKGRQNENLKASRATRQKGKRGKNPEAFGYLMPNNEGEVGVQPTGTSGMLTLHEQILQTRYFKHAEICRKKIDIKIAQ